jgi:hypothetical protein
MVLTWVCAIEMLRNEIDQGAIGGILNRCLRSLGSGCLVHARLQLAQGSFVMITQVLEYWQRSIREAALHCEISQTRDTRLRIRSDHDSHSFKLTTVSATDVQVFRRQWAARIAEDPLAKRVLAALWRNREAYAGPVRARTRRENAIIDAVVETELPETMRHVQGHFSALLALPIYRLRNLSADPLAFVSNHGVRRARGGIPLRAVLQAYRTGHKGFWAAMCAVINRLRQLKARYFRFMDTRDFDSMARVFCTDAVFDCSGGMRVLPVIGRKCAKGAGDHRRAGTRSPAVPHQQRRGSAAGQRSNGDWRLAQRPPGWTDRLAAKAQQTDAIRRRSRS